MCYGDNRSLMPSPEEISTMEKLVEILKHFYDAIEILSGELYPTIGVVFPILNCFFNSVTSAAKKIKEKTNKIW